MKSQHGIEDKGGSDIVQDLENVMGATNKEIK
jgi:hypothetical protein